MLSRYQKILVRTVMYGPVIVMLVMSGMYIARLLNVALENAGTLLVADLQQRFNREVRVKRVKVRPFGTAVLEGVEVAADKKLADGKMISIPRLVVHYDLHGLIFDGKGAQSVSKVEIEDPVINLVRRTDGTFNVQDLVTKPQGPSGPPFTGSVEVFRGRVVFTDYLAQSSKLPVVTTFNGITGDLGAGRQPVYSFSISARGEQVSGDLRAVGTYDAQARKANVDIIGEQVAARYWVDYFGLNRSVQVLGGNVDIALGIRYEHQGNGSKFDLNGAANVKDGSVQLPIFAKPLTGVSGRVVLSGQKAIANLQGSLGGSAVTAKGSIEDFTKPNINLQAVFKNANYPTLIQVVKLPDAIHQLHPSGSGPLVVNVTGPLSTPAIDFEATIPTVAIQGYSPQNVRVAASYKGDLLSVRQVSFGLLGGSFTGSGTVTTSGEPKMAIEGRVDNLSLANIPNASSVSASGTASASFQMNGTLANPRLLASVIVSDGLIYGLPVSKAAATVEYKDGAFKVSSLKGAGGPGNALLVSGQGTLENLDLTVSAQGAEISNVAQLLGIKNIHGTAYFEAKVTGSIEKPRFSVDAELFDGAYNGYAIDHACISFAGDQQGVRIKNAVVRLYPAELTFSGQVGRLDADRIPFQLDGKVGGLTLAKMFEMLGRSEDAAGTFSGNIEASGIFSRKAIQGESPFVDLLADADLRLEHGTVYGMPVNNAETKLRLNNNKLEIDKAQLSGLGAKISVDNVAENVPSSVALDSGEVNLNLKLEGLDLTGVKDWFKDYAYVGGVLNASAQVHGAIDDPQAAVKASIDNLSLNSRRFDVASISANYDQGMVSNFTALMKRGDQSFNLGGTGLNPETGDLQSAKGEVKNVSVEDLWGIVTASPVFWAEGSERLQSVARAVPIVKGGVVNGSFDIGGSLVSPTGKLQLLAKDMRVDARSIESVVLDATAVNGDVSVKNLEVKSQEARVDAYGGVNIPKGTMDLNVEASNFDLATLRPWLKSYTPGGVLSLEFGATGAMSSPQVAGTIQISKPSFGGVTFGQLRTEPITISGDRISFPSIMLAVGDHQAELSGYVPWDWSGLSMTPDKPLDVAFNLRPQSLKGLSLLASKALDNDKTAGTVEANLSAKGTPSDSQLSGYLRVHDGNLALRSFVNEFQNINVDLGFDGDKIGVNNFSADSSLGGKLGIVPGSYATILPGGNGMDARFFADKLMLAERNGLGFDEDVKTQVDAGVKVSGELTKPKLADADIDTNGDGQQDVRGGIALSNSRISFAVPTGPTFKPGGSFAIDPFFDLSLRVGSDVWVMPPSMAMHVLGNGTLKGSLSSPDFAMNLDTLDGHIRLAGTRMNLQPGGSVEMAYKPPADPNLKVDFGASTYMTAADQFGKRQRYRVDMKAHGPLGNLQVDLASTPGGLTREQMLAMLGRIQGIVGVDETQLKKEIGNALTGVVSSAFVFAPIESMFVDKLGFEQFTLDYAADRPLSLYLSKKLLRNMYLSYYSRLTPQLTSTSDANYELNLGYRLTDKYDFTFGTNAQGTKSLQAQYSIHF